MARMNMGRLVLGGLVAGVVANGLDYVINRFLMQTEMQDMTQRLNLSQEMVMSSMTTWIIVDFVWGLLLVFTYAAMRPRFGPGPKTAIVSGSTLWLAVCSMFAGLSAMGIYTEQAFIKSSALTLVSALTASLVGAAIYKEE
jgi:drug/metabolite transporter (DMT)-like permease